MNDKVILVIEMHGYPKHNLHDRIDELLFAEEPLQSWKHHGFGRHQYFYNSESCQLMYFTNFSIPEDTREIDVWDEIWSMELRMEEEQTELIFDEPKEFTLNGQRYLYIGNIHGYSHDSTSPEDDRYEA